MKFTEETGAICQTDGVNKQNQPQFQNNLGDGQIGIQCSKCQTNKEHCSDPNTVATNTDSADPVANSCDQK